MDEVSAKIKEDLYYLDRIVREIHKRIVGQDELIDRMLIGLLTGGHLLLEGVPGLAKTLAIKSLAEAISADFKRIQFTPDLLPADLIGTLIYNQKNGEFVPRHGPIFTNILLADEINRAPAKVQSALLEAMQERQVTVGTTTYPLPEPFLVLATQNPIEQEGTYPLPESQTDRFMLKIVVRYPNRDEERQILDRMTSGDGLAVEVAAGKAIRLERVLVPERLRKLRMTLQQVYVDERIKNYILDLVFASRRPADYKLDIAPLVRFGASPRATLNFLLAAKAHAFLRGRGFVIPEDVKAVGPDVLRHRLLLTYEAEAENVVPDDVVARLFASVKVP